MVAWGLVLETSGGTKVAGLARGIVEGDQTAPRAEFAAVSAAIMYTKAP